MSINSLFPGMESYLEGDVEINNNINAPDNRDDDLEAAATSAEVAEGTAQATNEAKDNEVASMQLRYMLNMYEHVKQYGIDRTFVSLYNQHGELDRLCHMRFPACESMSVKSDRYRRYSQAFIAAMEDEKEGLWAKFVGWLKKIQGWFNKTITPIWQKTDQLAGLNNKKISKAMEWLKGLDPNTNIQVTGFLGMATSNIGQFQKDYGAATVNLVDAAGASQKALETAGKAVETIKNSGNIDTNNSIEVNNNVKAAQGKLAEFDNTCKAISEWLKNDTTSNATAQQVLSAIATIANEKQNCKGKLDAHKKTLGGLSKRIQNAVNAIQNIPTGPKSGFANSGAASGGKPGMADANDTASTNTATTNTSTTTTAANNNNNANAANNKSSSNPKLSYTQKIVQAAQEVGNQVIQKITWLTGEVEKGIANSKVSTADGQNPDNSKPQQNQQQDQQQQQNQQQDQQQNQQQQNAQQTQANSENAPTMSSKQAIENGQKIVEAAKLADGKPDQYKKIIEATGHYAGPEAMDNFAAWLDGDISEEEMEKREKALDKKHGKKK